MLSPHVMLGKGTGPLTMMEIQLYTFAWDKEGSL